MDSSGQDAKTELNSSTQAWSWSKITPFFSKYGCSVQSCVFYLPPDCSSQPGTFCCALNLSDAIIKANYSLPDASMVNYCPHGRVRNADGMARICRVQNGGKIDVSGWDNRPSWKGIVYFEGNEVTQHIDFWDGRQALHKSYPNASVVWFWRMGT
ncbi:hypothetical protein V6x_51630 [Gimesia chilikensis]|uniref:Uncharacterized protein n=1 Tax=Gimesia chilikensis TaxID=2605989 RepID=A0A517WJJ3_9PLAN|nr:hypothetical protein [Gimesia chilikensis]KAA0134439.1 hypothetical protein FYZ48_20310 [Gimesia chilikensis]QDU05426.1 hypothetical protein V6x_51630 [Gimesia chilikensis]